MSSNPFSRKAYSPYDTSWLGGAGGADRTDEPVDLNAPKQTFTGADLQAYINNKRVGNLESITWSISVEVVGNYVMGNRNAVAYTTGKRVIAGSVVFSQYDKHAFLHDVWQLHRNRGRYSVQADLWGADIDTVTSTAAQKSTVEPTALAILNKGARVGYAPEYNADGSSRGLVPGLSPTAYDDRLKEQLMQTVRIVGSQKFLYSDQVPPFDLTLIGANLQGAVSRAAILGMKITQETTGFSSSDLSNAVGMSYVALAVNPWSQVENIGGNVYIPPVS